MFYFYGDIGQVRPLQNVFVCFLFARRLRLITEEKWKYRRQPRLKILRNFWDTIQNIKFDSWYPHKNMGGYANKRNYLFWAFSVKRSHRQELLRRYSNFHVKKTYVGSSPAPSAKINSHDNRYFVISMSMNPRTLFVIEYSLILILCWVSSANGWGGVPFKHPMSVRFRHPVQIALSSNWLGSRIFIPAIRVRVSLAWQRINFYQTKG